MWRKTFYCIITSASLYGGWIWFGNSGLGLLGLWLSLHYPRQKVRDLVIDFSELRAARLEPLRICLRFRTWRVAEIFRDEVNDQQWAALRRELSAHFAQTDAAIVREARDG